MYPLLFSITWWPTILYTSVEKSICTCVCVCTAVCAQLIDSSNQAVNCICCCIHSSGHTPSVPATSHATRRRLSFPHTTSSSERTSQLPSRFYSRTTDGDIFVPELPVRTNDDLTWQPGQHLPLPAPASTSMISEHSSSSTFDVSSVLQSMQHTIESSFREVNGKLSNLETRLVQLEKNQFQHDETETSSSDGDLIRKRRSPCQLQVCCFPCYLINNRYDFVSLENISIRSRQFTLL